MASREWRVVGGGVKCGFDRVFAFYDTQKIRIFSTVTDIPESIFAMIQQLLCPGYGAVFRDRVSMTLIYEDIQS